jgi:hypothetical protein
MPSSSARLLLLLLLLLLPLAHTITWNLTENRPRLRPTSLQLVPSDAIIICTAAAAVHILVLPVRRHVGRGSPGAINTAGTVTSCYIVIVTVEWSLTAALIAFV